MAPACQCAGSLPERSLRRHHPREAPIAVVPHDGICPGAARWPGEFPMATSTDRARSDPSTVVHDWETGHNVLAGGPEMVLQLLRTLPGYGNPGSTSTNSQ